MPMNNTDKMKFIVLGVASSMFVVSVVVQFFKPSQETSTVSNVFLAISTLVLGGSIASSYMNRDKKND